MPIFPSLSGRRFRYRDGVGYALLWCADFAPQHLEVKIDLHSFDPDTKEDIDQLIPLTIMRVPHGTTNKELEEKLICFACRQRPDVAEIISQTDRRIK